MESSFQAFISYSRKDKAFAAALERALEGYIPPSPDKKKRRLEVFRDEDDFAGTEYNSAIKRHLSESGKLVVICSPAARASTYVNEEIRLFASLHGSENIIPVLLSGLPNNEAKKEEEALMAFPEALYEHMGMPLAVNYTGFQVGRHRVSRGAFYGSWCMLLANLLNTSRDIIDERNRKLRIRNLKIGISIISFVALSLTCLAIWALVERKKALQRGQIMLGERLVAQSKPGSSLEPYFVERRALIALEGVRKLQRHDQPLYEAGATMREILELLPRRILKLDNQTAFAFSGNGMKAFSAAGRLITVHNLVTGKRIDSITTSEAVKHLLISERGSNVGVIDSSGRLLLWTHPGWKPWTEIPVYNNERIISAAFDHDEAHVVTLSVNSNNEQVGKLRVWSKNPLQLVAEHVVRHPGSTISQPTRGECLGFNADHILARFNTADDSEGSFNAILWRWRPKIINGSKISYKITDTSLYLQWNTCKDAAWDPSGQSLIIAGINGKQADAGKTPITIINPDYGSEKDGPQIKNFNGLSAKGDVAVSSQFSEDPYVPLLKYVTFTATNIFSGDEIGSITEFISSLWLTPGGSRMATGIGKRVRVWRTRGGREMFRIPVNDDISRLDISNSERFVATQSATGSIEIWDIASPAELLRLSTAQSLAISPNGRLIALPVSEGIMIADNVTGESSVFYLPSMARKAWFSPGGQFIVASTGDPAAVFEDVTGPKVAHLIDLRSRKNMVISLSAENICSFSAKGDTILLGGKNGLVKIIHSASGKTIWTKKLEGGDIKQGRIAPGGKLCAISVSDQLGFAIRVVVLALDNGKELLNKQNRSTAVIGLNNTGTLLATQTRDTVEITNTKTGRIVNFLKLPQQFSTSRQLVFAGDNRRLVSVSGNWSSNFMVGLFTGQTVIQWDLKSGRRLRQLPEGLYQDKDYQNSLREEDKPYFSDVLCSADARYIAAIQYTSRLNYWALASEYASSELRVWKMDEPIPVEVLRTPCTYEEVNGLKDMAVENGIVLTGGNHIRSWSPFNVNLIEEVCRRVSRNLSTEEWNELIGPAEPYCTTCPGLPKKDSVALR